MVKKPGQRRFLLKSGYTNEQLNHMSPNEAHTIISETEKANRERREAQAKEMASDMDYGCTKHDLWPDDAKEIAKALIILGYQKVKEDKIVISKQEYEELKKDCADIAEHYQEMGRFYDEKCEECDRISKEMTEKIINRVREMLWSCNTIRVHDEYTITPSIGYLMKDVDDGLDEIEKEFGIGIKE